MNFMLYHQNRAERLWYRTGDNDDFDVPVDFPQRLSFISFFLFQAFAMKVAFREGLKIPPPAMEQIIIGANQDIRQVININSQYKLNINGYTEALFPSV